MKLEALLYFHFLSRSLARSYLLDRSASIHSLTHSLTHSVSSQGHMSQSIVCGREIAERMKLLLIFHKHLTSSRFKLNRPDARRADAILLHSYWFPNTREALFEQRGVRAACTSPALSGKKKTKRKIRQLTRGDTCSYWEINAVHSFLSILGRTDVRRVCPAGRPAGRTAAAVGRSKIFKSRGQRRTVASIS